MWSYTLNYWERANLGDDGMASRVQGERNCRYIFYQENHTYTKIEKPHYCYKLLTCLLPYWIVCQEISHGHLPSHHKWTHKFHTRISGKKNQMQQIAPSFCFVVKNFKKYMLVVLLTHEYVSTTLLHPAQNPCGSSTNQMLLVTLILQPLRVTSS